MRGSVLSDGEIRRRIENEEILIEPVDLESQLQPSSLDIRLGDDIKRFKKGPVISIGDDVSEEMEEFPWQSKSSVNISDSDFLLANTVEYIKIPDNLSAELRGRSSLGRLGIEVHSCAGWIDPGFEGELVLEISNNSPRKVTLRKGMRVGQLVFYENTSSSEKSYGERNNRYQGQTGAQESKL